MIIAILAYRLRLRKRISEFSGCGLGNQRLGRFVVAVRSNCGAWVYI